ncbi:DNA-directed RNA polymerase subunit alpha C-terminal domain-containing protein [Sphingomonas sp.]|uniref:DNA-directed RNA polymerase subunit alpha C-terminal domain-containing protein n=1 Tax=Sphingomonas sp. TaxID=28214 RepID=UPI002EDA9B32
MHTAHFSSLSNRTCGALRRSGVETIADLCKLTRRELHQLSGVGIAGRQEILQLLEDNDLILRWVCPEPMIESFHHQLKERVDAGQSFADLGEVFGIGTQAAYELFSISERATASYHANLAAHVQWKAQMERMTK